MRYRTHLHAETYAAPIKSFLLSRLVWVAFASVAASFVSLALPNEAWAAQSKTEAETMSLSGSHVRVDSNSAASGGKEVAFYTNGSASSGFDGAASQVVLRARGTACSGDPRLKVYVDGSLKGTVSLNNSSFADYSLTLSGLSSGAHTLRISFENDFYTPQTCDRNAYLDYYMLTLPSAPTGGGGAPSDPVFVGAGDIANCSSLAGAEATAKLLDAIPGTVYTLGDNAYGSGTATEFANCYDPTWGRHKARTRPSPGNHEYYTSGASGYFGYFGSAAGDPQKGYYSYDLGQWHVVVLNSNDQCRYVSCSAGSAQAQWLQADLAAHPAQCTLAYFHHPLFTSGNYSPGISVVKPLWEILYSGGAEVVLNGHDHLYERFAPQTPSGTPDSARGIREFVVGTGGAEHYGIKTVQPTSEVRNTGTFGVLKLTLHPTSYDWQFVPEAGKTFTDSGTTSCH
jgi:acid phosphatase type 7